MRVSGKRVVVLMFAIAIGLCWWVRIKAPRISVQNPIEAPSPKKKVGYRSKMYPTMEKARSIAEKKLQETTSEKMIITKYESKNDGWLFHYETEKYLNSANPADKAKDAKPIFVNKEGTAEFFSEEKRKSH